MPSPSQQLAEHFHLQLNAEFTEWFDDLEHPIFELFNERDSVEDLIDPGSSTVWGGQMLPDSLPILGDGMGDKLCLRFNRDGTPREIIRWWHEGGAWLPAGSTVAAAQAYVTATGEEQSDAEEIDHIQTLHLATLSAFRSPLDKTYKTQMPRTIAKIAGMDWQEFGDWMFDPSRLPEEARTKIATEFSKPIEEMFRQDWNVAAVAAKEVIELRPELAWPYAVAGWAAEREGQTTNALAIYTAGLHSFRNTQDMTEDWMRQSRKRPQSFCEAGVHRLAAGNVPFAAAELLNAAKDFDSKRNYWNQKSLAAESAGRFDEAYDFAFRAGWDDFFTDDMEVLLERMAALATRAGSPALAALALHHRKAMQ